jgi:predicted LPLAT superfamily acyltransferase
MKATWLAQPERGSMLAIELIAWITLKVGLHAGRALLYPIALYFALFSLSARRSSVDYLTRVLGRRARFSDVLQHYRVFASTIHDRLYLLSGRLDYFKIELRGENALDRALAAGKGCVLLGSHLGSFEILRALGRLRKKLDINVVMHIDNSEKVNRVFNRLDPDCGKRVIAPGKPESLLRVKECLERNEIVGILGDRVLGVDRAIECEFLGEATRFPTGPLKVAAVLGVPVVLFFGLHRGAGHYEIVFEAFSEKVESSHVNARVQDYVVRLEHFAKSAPYNWFNFFDFWSAKS